jgi:hypothetical protein
MNKSTNRLTELLGVLSQRARALGLNDTEWSARAGLRKETLCRLRRRSSCDLATLEGLAEVVGSRVALANGKALELSPAEHFPRHVYRDYEECLLTLCASRTLEAGKWRALGPSFFMAGLAVMLASDAQFDRRGLLALAEQLHPGASEPAVFGQWLLRSPLSPSRFLPMLEVEARHAA